MSFQLSNNIKTSLVIYSIIILIIIFQKPKFIFKDNLELKILVLSKNRKYSIPVLYIVIILSAILAYYIPLDNKK
jgi:hypothetical protein